MKVLVTGGAGYIGSVTVKALEKQGHKVVVFDNLSQGHRENVSGEFVEGDLNNPQDLKSGLDGKSFDAVIHFAALALVGESMENPYKYYQNNIMGGLNLLEYMRKNKIPYIVFSSTSAIFGTSSNLPVKEDAPKHPESVYGETKYMFEKILYWYDKVFDIKSVCLRYFNAAGASVDGLLGEKHNPETHIIPIAISKALSNDTFHLFGDDYPTKDKTCIRDYIHVEDLAIAHIQALEYLKSKNQSNQFNLGVGRGHSNKEVIEMVKNVSGIDFPVAVDARRKGDAAEVYADNEKAKQELGFDPKYSDLETIVKTAWEYHKQNKN